MSELELLSQILEQLKSLNAALAPRRKDLSHGDHVLLAKLLPALAGKFGSNVWTTKELNADPVFSSLIEIQPRELGTLLSKAQRQDFDGFRIERVGREHGAALWKISGSLG